MSLTRIETKELYGLKDDSKGIIRIRPENQRDNKDWGRTWACLTDYYYLPDITCPRGIFLDISVHGGKNCLILEINTQKLKSEQEVHEYRFFPFKDFEKALTEMEKEFLELRKTIRGDAK